MAKRRKPTKKTKERSARFYGCLGVAGALIAITVIVVGFNLIRNAMQ